MKRFRRCAECPKHQVDFLMDEKGNVEKLNRCNLDWNIKITNEHGKVPRKCPLEERII